ncbi:MAG TPA: response regulator transcription factor [Actinomycetota bacterium]|nr:response regulator transcription factor [Actinomycetota bacterium]
MTPPPSRTTGVVLVEPVGVVRASLKMVFDTEPDFDVLDVVADTEAGLEAVRRHRGRLSIAIVGLEYVGERDALWLIRSIREAVPEPVVLATGTDLNRTTISRALFVGADGFIHKNSEPDRFVQAVRRAVAGELILEGLPRGALGEILDGMDAQTSAPATLTRRELDVLAAAVDGLTAREIGRRLDMRERTVTTHLDHIYRKLGATGRVSAIAAASRLGVLSIPATGPRSNGKHTEGPELERLDGRRAHPSSEAVRTA